MREKDGATQDAADGEWEGGAGRAPRPGRETCRACAAGSREVTQRWGTPRRLVGGTPISQASVVPRRPLADGNMGSEQIDILVQRLDRIEAALSLLVEQRTIKDWYTTAELATLLGRAEYT